MKDVNIASPILATTLIPHNEEYDKEMKQNKLLGRRDPIVCAEAGPLMAVLASGKE